MWQYISMSYWVVHTQQGVSIIAAETKEAARERFGERFPGHGGPLVITRAEAEDCRLDMFDGLSGPIDVAMVGGKLSKLVH